MIEPRVRYSVLLVGFGTLIHLSEYYNIQGHLIIKIATRATEYWRIFYDTVLFAIEI